MTEQARTPMVIVREILGLPAGNSWDATKQAIRDLMAHRDQLQAEISKAVSKLQAATGEQSQNLDFLVEDVRERLKSPNSTIAAEVKRRVRLAIIAEQVKRDGIEALAGIGDDKQQAALVAQLLTDAAYRVNS